MKRLGPNGHQHKNKKHHKRKSMRLLVRHMSSQTPGSVHGLNLKAAISNARETPLRTRCSGSVSVLQEEKKTVAKHRIPGHVDGMAVGTLEC